MRLVVAGGTGTVGRYVVGAARQRGHQVVVISRAEGVDLATGVGVIEAVEGADAIIDVSNHQSLTGGEATTFFTGATARLQEAGRRAGAKQLVVLSIVGVDRVPGFGYYQAKLAHERAALDGSFPATVLRATQFHEFPGQLLQRLHLGPVAVVPRMCTQTVAARTVGEVLVELAEGDPVGMAEELAGPEAGDTVDLARRLVARRGARVRVVPAPMLGASARAMRTGALLPAAGARLAGPTFGAWLAGPDADSV